MLPTNNLNEVKIKSLIITLVVGVAIWLIPVPEGMKTNAWHLLAIFVATIVGTLQKLPKEL